MNDSQGYIIETNYGSFFGPYQDYDTANKIKFEMINSGRFRFDELNMWPIKWILFGLTWIKI